MACAVVAVLLAPWLGGRALLIGLVPLVAIVAGPAMLISLRGDTFRHFASLCALYFAYGLARMIDLLGLSPRKPGWKSLVRDCGQ